MSKSRRFSSDVPSDLDVDVLIIRTGLEVLLEEAVSGNENARQDLESSCRELIAAADLVSKKRGAGEDS